MKLEMCESLLQSYLKYVKRCRLTQTNWKVSFLAEQMKDSKRKQMEDIYETLKEKFYSDSVKREQFIKQAEVDVIGYDFENAHLYFFESAFHENGTGYTKNGRNNNVPTILKKCFRSSLIGLYFFENVKALSIAFATPKINIPDHKESQEQLQVMKSLLQETQADIKLDISILANEDFESEILAKTISASGKVADTSDLFIRVTKMLSMFEKSQKLIDKKITNPNNDADAIDNAQEYPGPVKKEILQFYPSKNQFNDEAIRQGKFCVLGLKKDSTEYDTFEFTMKDMDYNSSLENRILSRTALRRKNRGPIVTFVAYVNPDDKEKARNFNTGI